MMAWKISFVSSIKQNVCVGGPNCRNLQKTE